MLSQFVTNIIAKLRKLIQIQLIIKTKKSEGHNFTYHCFSATNWLPGTEYLFRNYQALLQLDGKSPHIMESGSSWPCSQEPPLIHTLSYINPFHPFKPSYLKFILILLFHLLLDIPSGLFRFPHQNPVRTCPPFHTCHIQNPSMYYKGIITVVNKRRSVCVQQNSQLCNYFRLCHSYIPSLISGWKIL